MDTSYTEPDIYAEVWSLKPYFLAINLLQKRKIPPGPSLVKVDAITFTK